VLHGRRCVPFRGAAMLGKAGAALLTSAQRATGLRSQGVFGRRGLACFNPPPARRPGETHGAAVPCLGRHGRRGLANPCLGRHSLGKRYCGWRSWPGKARLCWAMHAAGRCGSPLLCRLGSPRRCQAGRSRELYCKARPAKACAARVAFALPRSALLWATGQVMLASARGSAP